MEFLLWTAVLALGVCLAVAHLPSGIPPHRRAVPVAVDAVLPPSTYPPVKEICFFETNKDTDNWRIRSSEPHGASRTISHRHATQGQHSMEIVWRTPRFADLIFFHFPRDWQHYRRFAFDLYRPPSASGSFELRVGDYYNCSQVNPGLSRYVLKKDLLPGSNRISVPMSEIAGRIRIGSERKIIHLRFFSPGTTYYIDNMRMEE